MSIRRILTPFAGRPREDMLDVAAALARRQGADLECLYFCRPNGPPDRFFGEIYSPGWTEDLAETMSKEARASADRARMCFEQWREQDRIRCRHSHDPVQPAVVRWTECSTPYSEAIGPAARSADLIVVSKGEGGRPSIADRIVEAALLTSGRPVLLVPGRTVLNRCASAIIAWNDSPQAARAVANALPLLEKCWKIVLLAVEEGGRTPSLKPVREYLTSHGIEADMVIQKPFGLSTGETLLMATDDARADLLVMGAYSHDRTRERLFGGATRDVMREARTLAGRDRRADRRDPGPG
ncbi:MAG TPA: universal stress protein, partial [Inquilinus sp.]